MNFHYSLNRPLSLAVSAMFPNLLVVQSWRQYHRFSEQSSGEDCQQRMLLLGDCSAKICRENAWQGGYVVKHTCQYRHICFRDITHTRLRERLPSCYVC